MDYYQMSFGLSHAFKTYFLKYRYLLYRKLCVLDKIIVTGFIIQLLLYSNLFCSIR